MTHLSRPEIIVASPADYRRPSRCEKMLSAILARTNIAARLTVTGRNSGQLRDVAVSTVDVDGSIYLVSVRGESEWVKNIRRNPDIALTTRGRTRRYIASEVPTDLRPPILAAKFGNRSRRRFAAAQPDAADHPVFALTARVADESAP